MSKTTEPTPTVAGLRAEVNRLTRELYREKHKTSNAIDSALKIADEFPVAKEAVCSLLEILLP